MESGKYSSLITVHLSSINLFRPTVARPVYGARPVVVAPVPAANTAAIGGALGALGGTLGCLLCLSAIGALGLFSCVVAITAYTSTYWKTCVRSFA